MTLCFCADAETVLELFERVHELFKLCGIHVVAQASLVGKTGVEMEALTAASVACLTIYDMCKAIDRGMEIGEVRLVHKEGGKSGVWHRS